MIKNALAQVHPYKNIKTFMFINLYNEHIIHLHQNNTSTSFSSKKNA